jgi:hypothetical protein
MSRWLTSSTDCRWMGISCNDNNEVIGIDLDSQNASGLLGSEIAMIPTLQNLSLSNNNLEGNLPTQVATLSNLQSSNHFRGTIFHGYGNLSKLEILRLNHNHFHGSFPAEHCNLEGPFQQRSACLRS